MSCLTIQEWEKKLKRAIYDADREVAKLSGFYREVYGISSSRIKCLINNICDHESIKYLELGIFRGSTIIAASACSSKFCYGVDNFSYNPYEKDIFNSNGWPNIRIAVRDNLERAKLEYKVKIIEGDLRDSNINLYKIIENKVNVVYFDVAPMSSKDKYSILNKIPNTTEDIFVLLVSEYIDSDVQKITNKFIKTNNLEILYQEKLISSGRAIDTGWYSGLGIFLLNKVNTES